MPWNNKVVQDRSWAAVARYLAGSPQIAAARRPGGFAGGPRPARQPCRGRPDDAARGAPPRRHPRLPRRLVGLPAVHRVLQRRARRGRRTAPGRPARGHRPAGGPPAALPNRRRARRGSPAVGRRRRAAGPGRHRGAASRRNAGRPRPGAAPCARCRTRSPAASMPSWSAARPTASGRRGAGRGHRGRPVAVRRDLAAHHLRPGGAGRPGAVQRVGAAAHRGRVPAPDRRRPGRHARRPRRPRSPLGLPAALFERRPRRPERLALGPRGRGRGGGPAPRALGTTPDRTVRPGVVASGGI